jgi:hypothetical protein
MQKTTSTYGFKIRCAFILACHKGLTCMLNTFVHTSFGLNFKNNGDLHNVHHNANE